MPDSINNLEIYRDAMSIGETVSALVIDWDYTAKTSPPPMTSQLMN